MIERVSRNRVSLLIALVWFLSAVCLNASGPSTQIVSFTAYAVLKAASRILGIPLLAGLIVLTDKEKGRPELLWRLMPLVTFALWTMFSTLWSPLKTVSLTHSFELLMLALLSTTVAFLCQSEEALKRLLFHMSVIILVLSAILLGANISLVTQGLRASNLMQANNMAAIAVTGLIVATGSLLIFNWRWTRLLIWPMALVCGGLVIVAQSRSALMLAALVIGSMLWRFRGRALLVSLVFCAGVFASAWPYSSLVARVPNAVSDYLMRGQTSEDAYTVSGRSELWSIALDSFKEAPLLGDGYYVMSPTGSVYVWGASQWQTAHNTYIHVLTGTGISGFLLMCWALLSALGPGWDALRRNNGQYKQALLASYVIVWCLLLGFFELSFAGPIDPMVLVFFIMLGLTAGFRNKTDAHLTVS